MSAREMWLMKQIARKNEQELEICVVPPSDTEEDKDELSPE